MICDHANACPENVKCEHKRKHAHTDMCRGCMCLRIDKRVNCVADNEEENFALWWDETYKGKLGLVLIEFEFKKVALRAWTERSRGK